MKSAILNPIKFYKSGETPDYLNHFPNFENISFGQSWIYGIAYSPEFIRFHIGSFNLQFQFEITDTNELDVYQYINGVASKIDTLIGTDISPIGWVSKPIYLFNVDLDVGCYYLDFDNQIRSDIFQIVDDSSISEDFVKTTYSNSVNDFGCIFDDGSTTYNFTSYFLGQLLIGQPGNEIDSYEDDRGVPVKLRSTPQRTAQLNIKGVSMLYADYFVHLFSCDTISVNDIAYENIEAPTIDSIEGSDLVNISVKLIQTTNDYYNG